jgi:hypothetical protein
LQVEPGCPQPDRVEDDPVPLQICGLCRTNSKVTVRDSALPCPGVPGRGKERLFAQVESIFSIVG